MAIQRMPRSLSDYVSAFDLTAIAVTRDGRMIVTRDPYGSLSAWWCEAAKAGAVLKHERGRGGGIEAAAQALGVTVTQHSVVLERAGIAVGKIDAKLDELRRSGGLAEFNRRYRARRIAAEAAGRKYMPYGLALARLRRALADAAAGTGKLDMAKVLEEATQLQLPMK